MKVATKHRSRFKADPRGVGRHGEHISGTPNQLALLDLLLTYTYLPSDYIRALLPIGTPPVKSGSIKDLITLFAGEGYIGVPNAAIGLSHFRLSTIYSLTPKGLTYLYSLNRPKRPTSNEQLPHKLLSTIAQVSFDVAPHFIPNLTVRKNFTGKFPKEIRPDLPPFAFEYSRKGSTRGFYVGGVEIDRGTEPLTGYDRQTIERKVAHYCDFYRPELHKSEFGFPNATTLFITVGQQRAHNIAEVFAKVADDLSDHFAVTWLPDFTQGKPFPPVDADLVKREWLTADGTLSIVDILQRERS